MADEKVIRRDFQAEFTPVGDGRTLDLRIIPYNTVARVRDNGGPEYDEEWLPGVFDKQVKAANRVYVNVEHEQGFRGVVGKGHEFKDSGEAFLGSVRIDEGPDGDKALRFINDGSLDGVSVEAIPLVSQRNAEGVVQRVKARLLNIALCRNPAFADAQVLAVREAPTYVVNFGADTSSSSPEATTAISWTGTVAREEPEPEPDPEPEPSEPEPPTPEPMPPHRTEEALSRIGYEPLLVRAVVDRPWDGSASRFEDDEYERSCLVCRSGDDPPKTRCSLPVLEPNGDLNVQGMHAAAGRLSQTGLTPQEKSAAARKLVRYYRQAGETPPANLLATASR
jgi:HK97 family phage prohead protease